MSHVNKIELILFSEIDEKVCSLEEWLCQVEGKMLPLKFHSRWSKEAIEQKTEEIQVRFHSILLKLFVQINLE
jgi:hypothetical protein